MHEEMLSAASAVVKLAVKRWPGKSPVDHPGMSRSMGGRAV